MSNTCDEVRQHLMGQVCVNFRFVEGGTLIIYLAHGTAQDESLKSRLWVECAWRLGDAERVLVGSLDQPGLILAELNRIKGSIVTAVCIDDITKDIHLSFSCGAVIESFAYSVECDVWELRRADGCRMGVGPGLKPFSKFEAPD